MSKRLPIFATFESMEEAIESIQSMKWTGQDVDQLSIAGKDWRTQILTQKHPSKGGSVETGSLAVAWDDRHIHNLKTAQFYCQGIGNVVLAGPLSRWAGEVITSGRTDDELNALGAGLHDLGLSDEDIKNCKADIKDGKILVVIPAKKHISRERGDKINTKIRISDMAKYR